VGDILTLSSSSREPTAHDIAVEEEAHRREDDDDGERRDGDDVSFTPSVQFFALFSYSGNWSLACGHNTGESAGESIGGICGSDDGGLDGKSGDSGVRRVCHHNGYERVRRSNTGLMMC
jgi:hypothetical protein